MRSGFGFRRHPILGYTKMHTGVDWAAPNGTPIFASGNGVVEKVGWEGGYGKYVRDPAYQRLRDRLRPHVGLRARHRAGREGAPGPGDRLRRLDRPLDRRHLHYEIVVNGRFVDPMRIRLPRGRVLEGPILAGFEKERDRVDGMMVRKPGAPARVAATSGN